MSDEWMNGRICTEKLDGIEWVHTKYNDGVEQVNTSTPHPTTLFIERVDATWSSRKAWHVVDRSPSHQWQLKLYAPIVAGPFPDLDSAKAAYLLIRAARSSA